MAVKRRQLQRMRADLSAWKSGLLLVWRQHYPEPGADDTPNAIKLLQVLIADTERLVATAEARWKA